MKLFRSALAGLVLALVSVTLTPGSAPALPASSAPPTFPIPWANGAASAYVRAIPQASQIGVQAGAASLTDGFPPLNFTPLSQGGVPPFGQDMNGILQELSANARWFDAGGPVVWSSSFSSAIGGYPKGAIVQSATTNGLLWLSTTDNNTTNPDTGGAGWTGEIVASLGYTPANKAGDTFTGNVNVGTNSATAGLVLNGPAGSYRTQYFYTGANPRWTFFADNSAESGSNNGSNLEIGRYADNGTGIDNPLTISRATGQVTVQDGLQVFGNVLANSSSGASHMTLNAPAGQTRSTQYQSAGVTRWDVGTNSTAESGSNVGSDFYFNRFADNGAYIDTPLSITRSTGAVSIADNLTVGGVTYFGGAASGMYAQVSGGVTTYNLGSSVSLQYNPTYNTTGGVLLFNGASSSVWLDTTGGFHVPGQLFVTGALTMASPSTVFLAAGTTSSAPLKFNGGSLLATPSANAVESDGTNLYYTQASGPTRKTLAYTDGSNFTAATVSAAGIAKAPASALFQQQEPSGTGSPDSLSIAWNTRTLNTTVFCNIPGATLSGNQITGLPAGTYQVFAQGASAGSSNGYRTRVKIYDVTDSTDLVLGTVTNSNNGATGWSPTLAGVFTISGTKTISLMQYVGAAVSGGGADSDGSVEVYASVMLVKIN
jgi:hypothetical protein